MAWVYGTEGGTALEVKPYELRLLIRALDVCRKDEKCSFGWSKDTFENIMCQAAAGFGKEETKDYFPEIDKLCSKATGTWYPFIGKKLVYEKNKEKEKKD